MTKDLPPINWITKGTHNASDADISVKVSPKGTVSIYFRNNAKEKVTETGYALFGTFQLRLYFRAASKADGYLIRKNNKSCANESIHLQNPAVANQLRGFAGDYDLLTDAERGMYYVDRMKKKS